MALLKTRVRLGVYFDAHGFERKCAILELLKVGSEEWTRLGALDVETGERVLDPPDAIPLAPKPTE